MKSLIFKIILLSIIIFQKSNSMDYKKQVDTTVKDKQFVKAEELTEMIKYYKKHGKKQLQLGNLNLKTIDLQLVLQDIQEKNHKDILKLEEIYLDHNLLSILPEEILNFKNLKRIHATNNKLTSIPTNIHYLKKLKYLRLHNNELLYLPENICLMKNLKSISASYNCLKALPQDINRLETLQSLNVDNNDIQKIPSELWNLKNLYQISLHGNKSLHNQINVNCVLRCESQYFINYLKDNWVLLKENKPLPQFSDYQACILLKD
ncbi:leucine-rich repeat domain-containing protein [Candidatus Dependentiae bacterium]